MKSPTENRSQHRAGWFYAFANMATVTSQLSSRMLVMISTFGSVHMLMLSDVLLKPKFSGSDSSKMI